VANEPNPKLIYQYTDHAALEGILTDVGLRATDCRGTNDPDEFVYGLEAAQRLLEERVASGEPYVAGIRTFIERAADKAIDLSFYIACLSERGDQLSQWTHYGNRTGSVSLGFEFGAMEVLSPANPGLGASLRRVLYDEVSQRELLEQVFPPAPMVGPWPSGGSAGVNIQARFTLAFIQCKGPAWEEEREWRIVVPKGEGIAWIGFGGARAPSGTNARGFPYFLVSLRDPDGKVPLREVVCTPLHEPRENCKVRTVEMLIAHGYRVVDADLEPVSDDDDRVRVRFSAIRYRP
jgi:hypothetical protein